MPVSLQLGDHVARHLHRASCLQFARKSESFLGQQLPREQWNMRDSSGLQLIHYMRAIGRQLQVNGEVFAPVDSHGYPPGVITC